MEEKKCSKCKEFFKLEHFYKRNDRKSGHTSQCKTCTNKRIKSYQNKDFYKAYDTKRKKTKKYKDYHTQYSKLYSRLERSKKYSNKYQKTRLKQDPCFKLAYLLRIRLNRLIKQKEYSSIQSLGCTLSELKKYIESKFTNGMNWDNHGLHGWHLDHIKPLDKFNLENKNEYLQACHYTNLQPLWAQDNLRKSNKY